jgi:hypothetical protein
VARARFRAVAQTLMLPPFIPSCSPWAGINAFTIGARSVNPAATVHVAYTSTWYDPATEREAAERLISNHSIRLVAQHQDGIEPQLAASRHGLTSIGYNADMSLVVSKDTVLTSLRFEWAVVYSHFVEQLLCDGAQEDGAACLKHWISGEQYLPGYQQGAWSVIEPSWRTPPSARAAMFEAQARLLHKLPGSEAVFCGPLASLPNGDEDQLRTEECLSDKAILEMAQFVAGVTLEFILKPADTTVRTGTDLLGQEEMITIIVIVVVFVLVSLFALAYLIRSHKDQLKRFLISFFKHEALLLVKIGWEVWVRLHMYRRALCIWSCINRQLV